MSIRSIIHNFYLKMKSIILNDNSQSMWSGNYSSWEEAKKYCTGYDDDIILKKCAQAILQVKNKKAIYERDSVLFDHMEYSLGLLAGLQMAAIENENRLNVLDFGGSLGTTYFQNKELLASLHQINWNIVEQSNFVKLGKEKIEDDCLKFYYNVEQCFENNLPNVILLSSVLQYLDKPYEWIEKFIKIGVPYIIIDRTAFNNSDNDILTIQNVPEEIYKASYPSWFFAEKNIKKLFTRDYSIVAEFESPFEKKTRINKSLDVYWNGFILKKRI